jgi:hypothetical protein
MKLLLASFNQLEPATALKERLEKAGIHAIVHDETLLQRFGFMTKPAAAEKVEVDEHDYVTASRLVQEWDKADGALRDAVRCPECQSTRVEYPQYTRKFVTPILVESFISLGLFPKEFYCQDCHYTWPKKASVERERDILGWPAHHKSKPDK